LNINLYEGNGSDENEKGGEREEGKNDFSLVLANGHRESIKKPHQEAERRL
jgi:hypothetical protein